MTRTLDLGCGSNPRNPFSADELFGVDLRDDMDSNVKKADLVLESMPYEDESFEYLTAYDFIEHVPRVIYAPARRNPFVELMNEVYRVLKPGGLFLSSTPAYPHPWTFVDPTHVNYVTDETFSRYFDNINRWATIYGFNGAFRIAHQEVRGAHLWAILEKVPVPKPKDAPPDAHPKIGMYPYTQFRLYQFLKNSNFPNALIEREGAKVVQILIALKQLLKDRRSEFEPEDVEKTEVEMQKCIGYLKTDALFSQVISLVL